MWAYLWSLVQEGVVAQEVQAVRLCADTVGAIEHHLDACARHLHLGHPEGGWQLLLLACSEKTKIEHAIVYVQYLCSVHRRTDAWYARRRSRSLVSFVAAYTDLSGPNHFLNAQSI